MKIEIITPTSSLYSGSIKQVNLPGSNGSFELLENHAPIIATLQSGTISIVEDSGKHISFDVSGGVVEQSSNKVIVLIE